MLRSAAGSGVGLTDGEGRVLDQQWEQWALRAGVRRSAV